jgi:hypothetical protein
MFRTKLTNLSSGAGLAPKFLPGILFILPFSFQALMILRNTIGLPV